MLGDDALHALLRRQFANPRKKHLISWNALHDVRGIPLEEPYRPASQADARVVRLALGRHLIATCDLRRGLAVDPSERKSVLVTARGWCLAEIERIVATLNPDGLLERLMHGYEAVMHARFEQEFKLPTRLACHESSPEMRSRLRSERPELARTAIAWRFLIEYVAAVPRTATRRAA